MDEAQILHLFEEAGLLDVPEPDLRRVDEVIERAMHEKVIHDLSSFIFKGVPAVIDGVVSVSTGKINHPDKDYRA